MRTDRQFSLYYDRRGTKKSPSVIKGLQMDKNDLVVGRVEPIKNNIRETSSYRMMQDSFLMWLEEYKKSLNKKLDKAEEKNDRDLVFIITGKIVTCNDIELAYHERHL